MAPREKKPTKSCDDDLKRKKTFFKQKFPGYKKKVTELSVLCGNSVGFICHGPDNDLHVWPDPQENPQALPEIVAKFNAMSDQKRNNHACDLYDFPNFKGSSVDELRIYLSQVNSHLLGVRRQKIAVLRKPTLKGFSDEAQKIMKLGMESNLKDMVSEGQIRQSIVTKSKPNLKETLEEDFSKKSLMVSNNATVSNHKASSSGDRLGFGGVFDELGYVVRGTHETVSNLGSFADSKVSRDFGVSDSSHMDPFALGFSGDQYLPADPTQVTYNIGFCANDGVWATSCMDLESSSTLFADNRTVSGYDPLMGAPADPAPVTYNTRVCANDDVWDPSCMDLESSSTLFADDWTVSGYDPFVGAPADPTPVTYNTGFCANDDVWDPSCMDLEFSSTLLADDWTVSGYYPFLGATDSVMASTYETSVTDNLEGVF